MREKAVEFIEVRRLHNSPAFIEWAAAIGRTARQELQQAHADRLTGLGTLAAQLVMRRLYRPLIVRNARHRALFWTWAAMYVFVGIQMGWSLRPFVGSPGAFPTFFRNEPFTNAYVEVGRIIGRAQNAR